MNLIYSPFYNSTSYLALDARKSSLLGTKVCGTRELLAELELRAGIVVQEVSDSERVAMFCEALKSMSETNIFTSSCQVDEIGVARQLMSWIEQLLLIGWTPEMQSDSVKLQTFSNVLSHYKGKTEVDRWNELVDYANCHRMMNLDDVIEVHVSPEYLPPVVYHLLQILENQASIKYVQPQEIVDDATDLGKVQRILLDELSESELSGDGTFLVYHFKTRKQAYEWYLTQVEDALKQNQMVVVNQDNRLLNDLALSMGMPMVHSVSVNSNPQLLQLFKLGLSLFVRPLNISYLLSYLQIPSHPLGSVSHQLARVLISEGGINTTWKEILDNYDFTDSQGKDKRKEKLEFIEMIDKDYDLIPVSDIVDYINHLVCWAHKQLALSLNSDIRKEQLSVLASYCLSLKRMLIEKEAITSEELIRLVDGIYHSQTFTHARALKGSPDTINSLTQLVDNVDVLYWLDCVGGELLPYPFEFLNIQEWNELKEKGLDIPSKSVYYSQLMKQQQQVLSKVQKQLILVSWDYDENHPQDGNPIAIGLKSKVKGWNKCFHLNEKVQFDCEEKPVKQLDIKKGYWLDTEQLKQRRRNCESNTSIQKMIQYPFDYVSDYLAAFWEMKNGELSDINITEGLVAHRYIENLFEEFGEEMVAQYDLLSDVEKHERLDQAIREKGAVLFLSEYKLEFNNFSKDLFHGISVLFEIIKQLKLVPQGCEVKLKEELDVIGTFEASIDMILRNTNGDLVIFDFKWSKSSRYVDLLKENKSIQLELYKQIVMKHYVGKKIAGVAYYLFPLQQLYSCDFEESEHIVSVKRNSKDEQRTLFEEICASYRYRREELDKGWVEQAELTPIEETDYGNDISVRGLYPLESDFDQKTLKSCPFVNTDKPFFSKSSTNRGKSTDLRENKTTHKVMKGRLL